MEVVTSNLDADENFRRCGRQAIDSHLVGKYAGVMLSNG
ncbi:hypothetical protein RSAG8_10080, partial [Rhizoctonia solani AG-8 WAC10335]